MASSHFPLKPVHNTPASPLPARRPMGTPPISASPAALSTPQILAEISRETQQLLRTQIDLVKAEVRADVTREIATVKGLGVAALAGLAGLNLLLVTAVLALGTTMPAWLAGLLVTAVVWLVGGVAAFYAWRVRVQKPLQHSRRALEKDVRLVKEGLS